MCGITGIVDFHGRWREEEFKRNLVAMTDALHHRGPDQGGIWINAAVGVGLGHRRLSIQDLSPAGNQPMASSNGRFMVVYNGEGYNALELRKELEALGRRFRGLSDTEVLTEGVATWGVAETLNRFNGMFAFAVWDNQDRRLVLGRDRLGIKPLYWFLCDGMLMFASELKALRAFPGPIQEINREALAAFLHLGYVPSPQSIYAGVHKLQPGQMLVVENDGSSRLQTYWSARSVAMREKIDISEEEATDRLEALLSDAVRRQMVSDVPVGAFLSGGIDSSTVVALMRAGGTKVRTFSIGFDEGGYDESKYAARVAHHLGTDHTELRFSNQHLLDLVPSMADVYDEPFGDSSQLPTLLLSRLARQHVTVALTGDGGDEVFAGYNRYFWGKKLSLLARLPVGLRRLAAGLLTAPSPQNWDRLARLAPVQRRLPPQLGDKLHKLARVLDQDETGLYLSLLSQWQFPELALRCGQPVDGRLRDESWRADFPDFISRMQILDTVSYLPDDILVKVDRASMAASLETRVPLLDHNVVEFAWTLPRDLLVRNGGGKWLLKRILHRHIPPALVERPKMGFGIPIGAWLKGPLRPWAEDLLDSIRQGDRVLDPGPVTRMWEQHLSGRYNWQYGLWNVFMFESWRRRWLMPDGAGSHPNTHPPDF